MTQTEEEIEEPTYEQKQIGFEQASKERLTQLWAAAGIAPRYPLSSTNVVKLLSRNGFKIDNEYLAAAIDGRAFRPPVPHGGLRRWFAADICRLVDQLDFLRRWLPDSPHHASKLTVYEAAGPDCFADLGNWSFGDILAMLHQPGCDLGARQALAHALRLKLAAHGIEV